MHIEQVSGSEINIIIGNKGHFNIIMSDWGGDYPGIDIEYVSAKGMKDTASKPRVIFELPYDGENPSVKVWENPNDEDYTYSHYFDMSQYETI